MGRERRLGHILPLLGISDRKIRLAVLAAFVAAGCSAEAAQPQAAYQSIRETAVSETVLLTGRDLSVEQVVRVARDGAKVQLSPDAVQRSSDAFGLLLQGAAEGVPIYWFNRGAGDQRETVIFSGDPTTSENSRFLKTQQLGQFRAGATRGYGPELHEEALVRAIMTIRANTMSYEAASPQLTRMLVELINRRITPVVQSRGTVGEGDLPTLSNIAAAMVGRGDVYYRGVRMGAEQALREAGLSPLEPEGADRAALISTNAYAQAQALFAVDEGRKLLEWADLACAIDLLGMNSSVAAIAAPVQAMRPYKWLAWDAERVLSILRNSYLLDDDPQRIIQDPESLRASTQRQGSAWQAWADLRDSVLLSINSSDHNPAVLPGVSPDFSWELKSPYLMKFFVKGGPLSHGKSGYILSNANWDPYPLANQLEAFTIAVANMGVVVAQRVERFRNRLFTVITAADVLKPEDRSDLPALDSYLASDLWQELAMLASPVPPAGQAIYATVEDLQAQTRIKGANARLAVDLSLHLLAQDVLTGTYWLELRKAQDPRRQFGAAPTAALEGLRAVVPWHQPADARPSRSLGAVVYDFMADSPASRFVRDEPVMPHTLREPTAEIPLRPR